MRYLTHWLNVGAGLLLSTALIAPPLLAGTAAASGSQAAAAGNSAAAPCFFRRDWKGGWKTTADARTMYIPVSGSIYRLDLQAAYPLLRDPWAVLVNKDSADSICGPLDFRLTVSNRAGIEQWPIVKRMTRLTPAEAAALPKKLRP